VALRGAGRADEARAHLRKAADAADFPGREEARALLSKG